MNEKDIYIRSHPIETRGETSSSPGEFSAGKEFPTGVRKQFPMDSQPVPTHPDHPTASPDERREHKGKDNEYHGGEKQGREQKHGDDR